MLAVGRSLILRLPAYPRCLPAYPARLPCLPILGVRGTSVHRIQPSPPQNTPTSTHAYTTHTTHPQHPHPQLAGPGSLQPECQPTLQSRFQGPQPTAGLAGFMGSWVLPPPPSVPFPPPLPSPTLFAGLPTRAADLGSLAHKANGYRARQSIYPPVRATSHAKPNRPASQPAIRPFSQPCLG